MLTLFLTVCYCVDCAPVFRLTLSSPLLLTEQFHLLIPVGAEVLHGSSISYEPNNPGQCIIGLDLGFA